MQDYNVTMNVHSSSEYYIAVLKFLSLSTDPGYLGILFWYNAESLEQ